MRTRTLLILAALCSVMILTAGVVQLLRLSNTSGGTAADSVLVVGETGSSEGLTARPVEVEIDGDVLRVVVELQFADDGITSQDSDGDAATHFRLLAGELRAPDASAADACGALTVPEQRCTLTFDTTGAPGGARLLVLEWAGARTRWNLIRVG